MTLTPQDAEAILNECPGGQRRRPGGPGPDPGHLRQPQLGALLYLRHHPGLPRRPGMGPGRRRHVHGPGRPQRQQGLRPGPDVRPGAVPGRIARRQGNPRPERGLQGGRRPHRQGRQHDGHGPGRHPAGPLDDHQVPGDRRFRDHRQPERRTGSSSSSSSAVQHLHDGEHPQPALPQLRKTSSIPAPSATQPADTPQPVRFINVDQILAAARSTADIPAAISRSPSSCGSGTASGPGTPTTSTSGT